MLDAIEFEKRGIPAASIGPVYLVNTVGLAMKKLHGMPDYPIAAYSGEKLIDEVADSGELSEMAKALAAQIEVMLIHK